MKHSFWMAACLIALIAQALPTTVIAASRKAVDAEPAVSPALSVSLQAAQDALQARKYQDALARVAEAEALGVPSPYERYVIDRLRGNAAVGSGDDALALQSINAALASGFLPAGERLQMLDAIARLSFGTNNFVAAVDAVRQYRSEGGNAQSTLDILPQTLYVMRRYDEAGKELAQQIALFEAAGKAPSERMIQMLADCALKQNDMPGYAAALRKLVSHYPSQAYWLNLIVRTAGRKGFSNRLGLDVFRLREQTATLEIASEYVEGVELALQAGFPGEADRIFKLALAKGLFGKGVNAEISRQRQLHDVVARRVAEDKRLLAEGERLALAKTTGDALVSTGLNYVAYGQHEKGIDLMLKGIARGVSQYPDEARLHLGYAYFVAGMKNEAIATFATVKAADGTRDLAVLWSIFSRQSSP